MDLNMIGEIIIQDPAVNILLRGKQENFELDAVPMDFLILGYNKIVYTLPEKKCLIICDQNLNSIKKIDRINNQVFLPYGIAVNLEEKIIYVSDIQQIIVFDYQFNFIKSVFYHDDGDNHFDYMRRIYSTYLEATYSPFNLCFADNTLFVCKYNNQRIQVYTSDLAFIKSLKMIDHPLKLKACNSILFVQTNNGLYLYKLSDLRCVQTYNHCIREISQMNTNIMNLKLKIKSYFVMTRTEI